MDLVTKNKLPVILIMMMIITCIPIFNFAGNCSQKCGGIMPKSVVQHDDMEVGKFQELLMIYL